MNLAAVKLFCLQTLGLHYGTIGATASEGMFSPRDAMLARY